MVFTSTHERRSLAGSEIDLTLGYAIDVLHPAATGERVTAS